MEIAIHENDACFFVVVTGELDAISVKEFKKKLFQLAHFSDKDIEIDLSNLDYIESSGVGVLVSLFKMQKNKGKKLKIDKVSKKVLNVLNLSSLSDAINLSS